ncbi:hypothetical protein MGN70_007290 [Eutypa lata]|nr:hypothetical protein MGN70_007290 [Eutypa lata]
MRGRDPTPAVPGASYTGDVLRMMGIVESGKDNSKLEKQPQLNKRHRDYGYGNRIYRTIDLRANFIRQVVHESLNESSQRKTPLLNIALEINRVASNGWVLHVQRPHG